MFSVNQLKGETSVGKLWVEFVWESVHVTIIPGNDESHYEYTLPRKDTGEFNGDVILLLMQFNHVPRGQKEYPTTSYSNNAMI